MILFSGMVKQIPGERSEDWIFSEDPIFMAR